MNCQRDIGTSLWLDGVPRRKWFVARLAQQVCMSSWFHLVYSSVIEVKKIPSWVVLLMFRTVTFCVTCCWSLITGAVSFSYFNLRPLFAYPFFESPCSDGSTGARSSEELGSAVGGEPQKNRWDPADPAVINHESSTIIGTWWYDDQHDSNVGKWPTLDLGYFCILKSGGKPQNSWFQAGNQSSQHWQHLWVQISKLRQDLLIRVDPSWSHGIPLRMPWKTRKISPWGRILGCPVCRGFPTKTMAVQRSPRSRHGCWILRSQRLQVFFAHLKDMSLNERLSWC